MNKISDIDSYLLVPYKDKGRSKKEGFDCWGLVLELTKIVHNFDLPDPEYKLKTVEDAKKLFASYNMYEWVEKVEFEKIRYGDLVTMRGFALAPMPYHIGMYIGNRKVIHCMSCGVVAQNIELIKNYITGVYRPKNDQN